jgi:hypothetical protein
MHEISFTSVDVKPRSERGAIASLTYTQKRQIPYVFVLASIAKYSTSNVSTMKNIIP